MTRIELTEKLIEKKKAEFERATEQYEIIAEARQDDYFAIIQKYFGGELQFDDVFIKQNYDTSYEVVRPVEGYSYPRELMTIRITDNYSFVDNDRSFKSINTSVYSTNDNSDFELERLICVGQVATVILDFKDDILAEFNHVLQRYQEEILEKSKLKWKLEGELRTLENDLSKFKFEDKLIRLESEGIEFEKPVNMSVRWDWTVRRINKAKITSKSKSGKTVDLDLVTENGPLHVENVKLSNLESILF